MRGFNNQRIYQRVGGKKRPHWAILTLDDLSKTNQKHSHLNAQLRAQFQADKELGKDKPGRESEDNSI